MAAGDLLLASDFGSPFSDLELTDETAFTTITYAAGSTPTGTTFVAPTSGIVLVLWRSRFQSNTANARACISVSVRTGSTLGSGTLFSPSDDDSAIESTQGTTGGVETRTQCSCHRVVTGLSTGAVYNVQVEHKMLSAGNGTIFSRTVDVLPWPI